MRHYQMNDEGYEENQRRIEETIALSELGTHIAHKLKNSLAGMMLAATRLRKLLKDSGGQEKTLTIAEHLCDSISAFSDTIDRVVDIVIAPKLERKPVNVNKILAWVLASTSSRTHTQGIEVRRELAADLPEIFADAEFLKRAFLNLIANALDALPPSGSLTVVTRTYGRQNVEVSLTDTKTSADIERMKLLLNKPFSVGAIQARDLDLSIARRIIELHSGSIALQSGKDCGVEVIIRFPVCAEQS